MAPLLFVSCGLTKYLLAEFNTASFEDGVRGDLSQTYELSDSELSPLMNVMDIVTP